MIIDSLSNADKYIALHPRFKQAFEFLRTADFAALEDGKVVIDGTNLYANIDTPAGKPASAAKLEFHRKYIDIQYVISGDETMGWAPVEGLGHPGTYDAKKDVGFAEDKPLAWFPVRPGSFAIFFPEDAHAPCVGPSDIHKAVVKVLL